MQEISLDSQFLANHFPLGHNGLGGWEDRILDIPSQLSANNEVLLECRFRFQLFVVRNQL